MQMLINYKISDYAKFKSAFDGDSEDRSNNGLSLLQLWRESNSSAWALFDLHDAKKARDYLDGAAGAFNSLAGVSSAEAHTLETA
ncbi:hypothetical protein [Paracoccus aerodenitrificans]|uniref:hypothetical protein n=1 Tax=Paracoccus aerodenitrificans TaxID=3017781 RepID=UPI0022F129EE|nr:hypothetical protein [Paracoccus aerodenitrificans]WBU65067.1 hypothetical protein PAE61_06450 [Paracoccus aerodenitrificans]